ncbi:hypothetical protein IKU74_08655 [bacterium]|nr:hypothetical protein [bacterium]
MNRTRILGGFSLVELMLLLIVVSLMIAAGVSVISKRHVKVPRVAMHGAYICYTKPDPTDADAPYIWHEEQYVGAGQARKVWDADLAEDKVCRFVPPERASYFYVQAVAGGGGGGHSGYDPLANREVIWSATEVISPFGITPEILKLKGISAGELQTYGGTLHAYAKGDEKYGDAGNGGDIYYIKRDADGCYAYRKWNLGLNEGGKKCENGSSASYSWSEYNCYWETKHNTTSTYEYGCSYIYDSYPYTNYTCHAHKKVYGSWSTDCNGTVNDPCSCPSDTETKDYSCSSTSAYKDGVLTSYYYKVQSRTISEDTSKCISCSYTYYNDHSCTNVSDGRPIAATCTPRYQTVTVNVEDTYSSAAFSNKPPMYYLLAEATMKGRYGGGSGRDAKQRDLIIDIYNSYDVCNYGNQASYVVNKGITGSCFLDYDCDGFTCDTTSLTAAFGDGYQKVSTASTSINDVETKLATGGANGLYPNATSKINGKTYDGIWYDLSEENGGIAAYGIICKNTYDGDCGGKTTAAGGSIGNISTGNGSYTRPTDDHDFLPQETVQTGCNITDIDFESSKSSCESNAKSMSGYVSSSFYCNKRADRSGSYLDTYYCVNKAYDGQYCMYSPTLQGSSTSQDEYWYTYVIDHAEGENGGKGKKCALSSGAGVNLEYKGRSSIVPGIHGSDKKTNTVTDYKAIFCENCGDNYGAWKGQQETWAEDGASSQGFAEIQLGGSTCNLHGTQPPTKGRGACVRFDGTEYAAYPGADYASCEHTGDHPKDGSCTGGGCGTEPPTNCSNGARVGYCLQSGGNIKPFAKYTYKFSWARNTVGYGDPGLPGEYRSMIIRSFNDNRDLLVIPGFGGKAGTQGDTTGKDGGDTMLITIDRSVEVARSNFEDAEAVEDFFNNVDAEMLFSVKGGAGGLGGLTKPVEQLPYHFDLNDPPEKGAQGELGSRPNFDLKSNVMGMVLPLDDSVLGQWLAYSGSSGNGGGSINKCWLSSWAREFEGKPVQGDVGFFTEADISSCTSQWEDVPPTDGAPGAVLIKW